MIFVKYHNTTHVDFFRGSRTAEWSDKYPRFWQAAAAHPFFLESASDLRSHVVHVAHSEPMGWLFARHADHLYARIHRFVGALDKGFC